MLRFTDKLPTAKGVRTLPESMNTPFILQRSSSALYWQGLALFQLAKEECIQYTNPGLPGITKDKERWIWNWAATSWWLASALKHNEMQNVEKFFLNPWKNKKNQIIAGLRFYLKIGNSILLILFSIITLLHELSQHYYFHFMDKEYSRPKDMLKIFPFQPSQSHSLTERRNQVQNSWETTILWK